jgi:Flp pilus assembly secretin CpaC
MKSGKLVISLLCLALAGGVLSATISDDAGGETQSTYVGPNIKITLTVGDVEAEEGPTVRHYALIARDGGSPASLLMGWRTPIPTSTASDDGSAPVTSYVYQNVGMTARIEARVLDDDRILVSGAIEISGARREAQLPGASKYAPTIGTFQQELNVLLRKGKPLRVAEVPDPEGGTMYLELEAEILD